MHLAGDPRHAEMPQGAGELRGAMLLADLRVLELAPHHARQTVEHQLNSVFQPAVAVFVEVIPVGCHHALLNPRHRLEAIGRVTVSSVSGNGLRQSANH